MEGALAQIFETTESMVFVAAGIFTRVAAALFLVPGLGERAISMRIRLGAALAITFILVPIMAPMVPAAPTVPTALVRALVAEAATGLVIGFAFRCLIFALQTAGMIAAQNISVSQMFGAGVAPEPEPTIATMLSMAGIALMLMAGLHVQLIAVLAGLYAVFPFGQFPIGADVGQWAIERVSDTFALGVTLAAPFVAIGFAYNLALGALNRAMPQLLVALVGVPFLVWIGVVVLYHVTPAMFESWGARVDGVFLDPLGDLR